MENYSKICKMRKKDVPNIIMYSNKQNKIHKHLRRMNHGFLFLRVVILH